LWEGSLSLDCKLDVVKGLACIFGSGTNKPNQWQTETKSSVVGMKSTVSRVAML
jgi:hypothetical protein